MDAISLLHSDPPARTPHRHRSAFAMTTVALLALAVAGCSGSGTPSSVAGSTAAAGSANTSSGAPAGGAPAIGAPAAGALDGTAAAGSAATGSGFAGPGVVSTAPNMAFPYPGYPGVPGLAPDHTIVVTGTGSAPLPADGSNRAAAEKAALAAALDDAATQAAAIAAATHSTLGAVISVSASIGQNWYGIMPMGAATPGQGSSTGSPTIVPGPGALGASVTVEYRIP